MGSKATREDMEIWYGVLAGATFIAGLQAMGRIFKADWYSACILLALAVGARTLAGFCLNRIGDAEVVNDRYEKYHRKIVIMSNLGFGAVLLATLWWDWFMARWHIQLPEVVGARWIVTIAVALYLAAIKFMWRNTFMARVGSAAFTIVLACIPAYLAWPQYAVHLFVLGVLLLHLACLRLHALKGRFGWSNH